MEQINWTVPQDTVIAQTVFAVLASPKLRASLIQSAAAQLNLPLSNVRSAVRAGERVVTGVGTWPRASKQLVRLLQELA
jgi:hypothetical protein